MGPGVLRVPEDPEHRQHCPYLQHLATLWSGSTNQCDRCSIHRFVGAIELVGQVPMNTSPIFLYRWGGSSAVSKFAPACKLMASIASFNALKLALSPERCDASVVKLTKSRARSAGETKQK